MAVLHQVAIYARVSKEEEEHSPQSIENQLNFLRQWAGQLGYAPEAILQYVDRGETGASLDRPGLSLLRADAKEGKFDKVICFKLDRLSRNLDHIRMLVFGEFKELRTQVVFRDLPDIDITSANGEMIFNTLANLAQWQRRYTSEVTSFHLQEMKKRGLVLGRPPYGFKKAEDPEMKGHWLQDENEQAVIQDILTLCKDQGRSYSEVARILNTSNICARSGKRWYPKTVRAVVLRKVSVPDQKT